MLKTIQKDFVELRKCPIELHHIEMKARSFYLNLNGDEDIKLQCLDARNDLDSARVLVRNLLMPEKNKYINDQRKAFFWMLDNLGRVSKLLNKVEIDTIEKLDTLEYRKGESVPNSPKIRRYINSLVESMEHLVYFPLKKALEQYKNFPEEVDGEKVIKDKDLFLYCLFLELYHTSESIGSISAEEIKTIPKTQEISYSHSTHETKQYNPESDSPQEIPTNIKTKSNLEPEQKEYLEEAIEYLIEDDIYGEENVLE